MFAKEPIRDALPDRRKLDALHDLAPVRERDQILRRVEKIRLEDLELKRHREIVAQLQSERVRAAELAEFNQLRNEHDHNQDRRS